MKRCNGLIFFLFAVLMISGNVISQEWLKNIPAGKENNFFAIKKAFEDYWAPYQVENGYYMKDGQKTKAPYWKLFRRWAYYWESRVNQRTGEFPKTSAAEEFRKYITANGSIEAAGSDWSSMGPSYSDGGYAGIGRINCISFHPADTNTFWVGAASGGLWKTVNGGASWTVLNDNMDVLGVSDIGIPSDYAATSTIYLATGDKDGGSMWSLEGGQVNDNESVGIMKSTNGGTTWYKTSLTFTPDQHNIVSRILIHPTSTNILWASTSTGIYKSTDYGENWAKLANGYVMDMEFRPGDPNTIYASTMSYSAAPGIYKTTNGGTNWFALTTGLAVSDYRVDLAVTPANPNFIYAISCNQTSGLGKILRSNNGGTSFTTVYTGGNNKSLLGWYSNASGTNEGQGTYDLAIAVSPVDTYTVYIGGVNTHKSTNGGGAWFCVNCWTSSATYNKNGAPVVHADHHMLSFRPGSNALFETNDGGVYKTYNGGASWTDLTDGIVPSQIYRVSTGQKTSSEVLCGLQDNGTKLYSAASWSDVTGGDGMDCLVDFTNNNVQYATYAEGTIYRTTNHWAASSDITPGTAGTGHWVTPLAMNPVNSKSIYAGYADLWKSVNQGTNWTKISTMNTTDKLRAIAVAPSDTQRIYVSDPNQIWKTTNGGTGWSEITGSLPTGGNSITYIAVKNDDPNTVWITLGGYDNQRVFETTNGGTSWINISAGLPNLPVMSIVQNKQNTATNELYVGTDRGVYTRNGGNFWEPYNANLPNAVVADLDVYYDTVTANSRLRAGTFGRGLWQTPLQTVSIIADPSNFTATAVSESQINLAWTKNPSAHDVMIAVSTTGTFGTPVNGTSYNVSDPIPGGGAVLYRGGLTSYNHTGLPPGTDYYYKAWSFNGGNVYSGGMTDSGRTFCGNYSLPFTESFTGSALPSCWSTQNTGSGMSERWGVSASNSAGGTANEMKCSYHEITSTCTTRLITPALVTTGMSQLNLSFKHFFDDYGTGVTLRVQSSTDLVNWTNEAWSAVSGGGNLGPATVNTTVSSNLNSPNTYIAVTAIGNLYNMDYWYIDDVSVSNNAPNQPPVVSNPMRDTTFAEDFGRLFVRKLSTVFSDPDTPVLTYTANALGSGVTAGVSGDSLYINSVLNYYGSAVVRVTASDGSLSVSDTFNVTITNVNDAPYVVLAIPDTAFSEDFGKRFIRKLTNVFADADNPTLTYAANVLSGSVTTNISNDSLYINSVLNYYGSAVVRVTASDGSLSVSDTFNVTITNVNDAPYVVLAIPDTAFSEDFGKRFIRKLTNVFADADNPTLTYAANVLSGSVTTNISNDSLYINSVLNYYGSAVVRVTASDGSLSVSDTFNVTITNVNDAPYVVLAIPDTAFSEDFGKRFIRKLTNVFADADNPTLTYAANVLSGSVTTSISGDSLYLTSVSNYSGSAQVRVTASDGAMSALDTFNVTITAVNDPPYLSSAVHDTSLVRNFGKVFISRMDQIFTDPDNSTLTYGAYNLSAGINPVISNDSLYLQSTTDFLGQVLIRLTAYDGQYSAMDTFKVSVVLESDPPYIVHAMRDTSFSEDFGRRMVYRLTEVFGDNDTPELTYFVSVSGGGLTADIGHDSLYINSVNNINGIVSVFVSASDGASTVSDSFSVTITAVNDVPYVVQAIPDTAFSEDFGKRFIRKLTNVFADADNGSLTYSANVLSGSVTTSISGDSLYVTSVLNYNGIVNVRVTANDGSTTVADTFAVTITPVNDPPYVALAIPDTAFSEDFGKRFIRKLTNVFADVDNPTLTYSTNVLSGSVTANISGDSLYINSVLNYYGMAVVRVSASDGSLSVSDTFNVTITNVNDAPYVVLAIPDTAFSEDFGKRFIRKLTNVFADADNPTLTYAANVLSGSVTTNISNDSLYINSVLNYYGMAVVRVSASDGSLNVSDTFNVTITNVNDQPIISDITDISTDEDTPLNGIAFTVGDADNPPENLILTRSSSNTVLVSNANIVFGGSGTNRTLSITPNADQYGTTTISVIVSDGITSDTDTFVLTVNAVNDPPTISDISDQSTNEDTPITGIAFTIGDNETPLADLTLSRTSSNTTLVSNGNIIFGGFGADRTVSITPNANQSGTTTITVIVSDGIASDTDTFVLTVNGVNDPVSLSHMMPDTSLNENFGYLPVYQLSQFFTDTDNLILNYNTSSSAGINTAISGDTLYLSGTQNFNGPAYVYVSASDGEYTARDTFKVTVLPVNDPPYRVTALRDTAFAEDFGPEQVVYRLSQFFADADNATLNYAAETGPGITAMVSGDTLYLSGTLNFNGLAEVHVSASDGEYTVYDTFNVTVTPVNDAPHIAIPLPDLAPDEDFGLIFVARLGDVFDDVDGDTLSFWAGSLTAGVSELISRDSLYLLSVPDFTGTVEVRLSAGDGEFTVSDTFRVTVLDVNDPPFIMTAIPDTSPDEDFGRIRISLLSSVFGDVDNAVLIYTGEALSSGLTADIGHDTLYLNSEADYSGTVFVRVSAGDGNSVVADTFAVTVMPVNDAPLMFTLISPADGDTLASLSAPMGFAWHPSLDADGDALHYALGLFHPAFDTLIIGIADTSVYVDLSGRLLFDNPYRWTVSVTDGFLTVASTDTYRFRTPVLVGIPEDNLLPSAFALRQNYPNPFNPSTTIHYDLPKSSNVRLNIYNIQGQRVMTLVNGQKTAGRYQVSWNGRNERGQMVSSGIYIYRIQAGDFIKTRKMMLLK